MKNGSIIEGNTKFWYRNDLLHREDGPAVECANGNKLYYKYGKSHREDGPAIDYANGHKKYWICINDNIYLFFHPKTKQSLIYFDDGKIPFECNSEEEFIKLYNEGLYKVYLTFA